MNNFLIVYLYWINNAALFLPLWLWKNSFKITPTKPMIWPMPKVSGTSSTTPAGVNSTPPWTVPVTSPAVATLPCEPSPSRRLCPIAAESSPVATHTTLTMALAMSNAVATARPTTQTDSTAAPRARRTPLAHVPMSNNLLLILLTLYITNNAAIA